MPWCPDCKSEYREGFDTCSDCDVKLVDKLDIEYDKQKLTEAYLTTVSDDMEGKIIESLLGSYDIQVMRKHRGSGAYTSIVLGKSIFGIDLYVAPSQLDEAKEIISQSFLEKDQGEEGTHSDSSDGYTSRKINRNILLYVVVLPVIVWLLYSLYQTLSGFLGK